MASEIRADYASGHTLYAVIRSFAGLVWCPLVGAFEAWGSDGHNADDYDIPLIDRSGSLYVGDFDADIPAGRYVIQVFVQSGATPVDVDTILTSRPITWSGMTELTAIKILINRATQDKVNGTIDYYDDDGQTVMLTLTTYEETSTLTRDPN